MARTPANALYVFALVTTIVVLDVFVFRHRLWERLAANVGLVLVFGAFYFRFLHRS